MDAPETADQSPEADAELIAELFYDLVDVDIAERRRLYDEREISQTVRTELESLLDVEPIPEVGEEALESTGRRLSALITDSRWEAGTRVGDYEIVREIARGGMGVVYEAQQQSLGRRVAIKVVRGARFADPSELLRFRSEAEAIARLEHPGIVPVHEVAEHDGQQFFSMAYLGGGSLRDLETPMPPRRAAELVRRTCDAIHHAHTQNIVHRDLKPANVLLNESGEPRVSDFGLAKDVSEDSDLTHTGAILGTPGFMAPEQAGGRNEVVGHLADVYGLGAILFYLLTGRPPRDGASLVETLHKVLHDDAPDVRRLVPRVPADLASICRKALERAPIDRYGSAAALGQDLRRFLADQPTEARPLGGGTRALRWCRRRPAIAGLAILAVLGVFGGGVSSYVFALDARDKASSLERANLELGSRNTELAQARDDARTAQRDAERSRDEARRAQRDERAFSGFLVDDVFGAARPIGFPGGQGTGVAMREALLGALPRISERFSGNPVAEALCRHELGVTLRYTGAYDQAIHQLEIAHDLRLRELGPNDRNTVLSANSLGAAYFAQSQFARSVPIYEDLVERTRQVHQDLHPRMLANLAANYEQIGRLEDQLDVLGEVVAVVDFEGDKLRARSQIASTTARLGRESEARRLVDEIREEIDGRVFSQPAIQIDIEYEIVSTLRLLGDDTELIKILPDILDRSRAVFSPASREASKVTEQLVDAYLRKGLRREAFDVLKVQVRLEDRFDGRKIREHAERLARLALQLGLGAEAVDAARSVRRRWLESESASATAFRIDILTAEAWIAWGRPEEARKVLQSRIELLRKQVESGRGKAYTEHLERFESLLAGF